VIVRRVLVLCCAAALLVAGPGRSSAVRAAPGEGGQEGPKPGSRVLGDGLIIPGQRVGPIRLGMSIDQILASVGTPPKRDEFSQEGVILYEWRAEGLWVSQTMATKAIRVISVFGASGKYHTDKGVALLNTRARMESVYGKGFKEYDYPEDKITLIRYNDLGLQFGIVNQPSNAAIHNRIFQIGIYKPGTDLPLLKQPTK
jgi:hypothetical protein